jgi:putative ABC transport system ATP-binding protein
MSTVAPILDVRDLSKTYRIGRQEVPALAGVSFTLAAGRTLAITGPSGSGKTTLLNLLAGLDRPTGGEVRVAGARLDELDADAATVFRRRHIGFVFQFFNLMPTLTAAENVELPLLPERISIREIRSRARAALDLVGLEGRAAHRPAEMSGGEQQRVAIARALVGRPPLLLADEPTGNLDSATGNEIVGLLRRLVRDEALALVVVTHADAVARACDEVMELRDGRLAKRPGSSDLSARIGSRETLPSE